jgi:hypothetical protein
MDINDVSIEKIKNLFSARSVKALDKFLDAIPANVGLNVVLVVGMMWLVAIAFLYMAVQQLEDTAMIRREFLQVESLKPPIPEMKYVLVKKEKLVEFGDNVSLIYKGLHVSVKGDGKVSITAQDTDFFPQFISGISYFQRGDRDWRVNISKLCAGRDCKGSKLSTDLKIEKVMVEGSSGT